MMVADVVKRLRELFGRVGQPAAAPVLTAASLTARTPEQDRNLQIAWWYWRKHYLAAQWLRVRVQRSRSTASRGLEQAAVVPADTSAGAVVIAPAAAAAPAAPQVTPAVAGAAQVLAAAFEAAQQEPPPLTPIAGSERTSEGNGPIRRTGAAPAAPIEEPPSRWPQGPGQLAPRVLERVMMQLLADPDVQARGVTRNKLRSAGAGDDIEALLAWLDSAGVLQPSTDQGRQRWRAPRPLELLDPMAIAARLDATPLPDEALVDQVRAAFGAVVGGV